MTDGYKVVVPPIPEDPQDLISRGLVPYASVLNKWGYRTDIYTTDGDALIIADNTTNTPTILTTASTFTVTYNNTTDGLGTTGALSILFTYLDENQAIQTATHVLGNTGSDTTSFSGLGINKAVLVSTGSAKTNTNNITVTATTGGSVQAFIPALNSVTQQMVGHLPTASKGVAKFLFLSGIRSSGGGSPELLFKIYVYSRITDTTYEVFRYTMDTGAETHLAIADPTNFTFTAGDVFWVTANTSANNASVSARLSLDIYENS